MNDNTWASFCSLLDDITTEAAKIVKLPTREATQSTKRAPFDPEDAQKIQKLYRRNRRQAVRMILAVGSLECAIPVERAKQHFK